MSNNVIRMWNPPTGTSTVSATGPLNSGQTYTSDAFGYVAVDPRDVPELMRAGFMVTGSLSANFKNLFDGGEFTVNPFQRNVPGLASGGILSAAITNTPGYFADRWFAVGGSASSSILMASVADISVPGFSQSLQVYRSSGNANTAAITFGQVLETADCIRCQGQLMTASFWAKQLAGYTGGQVTMTLYSGTGSNQSAASLVAGTWTGQVAVATAAFTPSGGMSRMQITGAVPLNSTQLGFTLSWIPTGTAGANDGLQLNGFQFEHGPSASSYERRDVQVELEICQRYAWLTAEPAAAVVVGVGMNTTTAIQVFYMATPVQLRAAPTVTVAAGTFKTNQASTPTATTITPGTTHTPNAISIAGNSAGTAGQGTMLQGGGGSGWILASADF